MSPGRKWCLTLTCNTSILVLRLSLTLPLCCMALISPQHLLLHGVYLKALLRIMLPFAAGFVCCTSRRATLSFFHRTKRGLLSKSLRYRSILRCSWPTIYREWAALGCLLVETSGSDSKTVLLLCVLKTLQDGLVEYLPTPNDGILPILV